MHFIDIIDNKIYTFITQFIDVKSTIVMTAISHFASAFVLILFAVVSFFVLKNKKDAKYIMLNLVLVFAINRILKYIIKRPRPNGLRLVPETRI